MPWTPLPPPDEEAQAFLRALERPAKFLTDENVDVAIPQLLASRDFDTVSVMDKGLAGASDDAVFQLARDEHRILLTHDEDFLDDRRFPLELSPGIIVMRQPQGSDDKLVSLVRLAIDVFGPWAELWEQQKITLSPNGKMASRVREFDTAKVTRTRYRVSADKTPEVWADEE